MISVMLSFKITGVVFGMSSRTSLFFFSVSYSIFVLVLVRESDLIRFVSNRVDLGTSDYFAIDVLLNCLTVLSSE